MYSNVHTGIYNTVYGTNCLHPEVLYIYFLNLVSVKFMDVAIILLNPLIFVAQTAQRCKGKVEVHEGLTN